jgi:hypothetical protein
MVGIGNALLDSGEEDGDERLVEHEEVEKVDAGLPVTQPDDPRRGGHFSRGTSKPPLSEDVS